MTALDSMFGVYGRPTLQKEMGQAVTLKGRNCDDLDVTAVSVSPIAGEQKEDDGNLDRVRSRTVTLKLSDLTSVDVWDQIVIGGETWHLEQPPQSEGHGVVVFRVKEVASMERTRPDYRGAG